MPRHPWQTGMGRHDQSAGVTRSARITLIDGTSGTLQKEPAARNNPHARRSFPSSPGAMGKRKLSLSSRHVCNLQRLFGVVRAPARWPSIDQSARKTRASIAAGRPTKAVRFCDGFNWAHCVGRPK